MTISFSRKTLLYGVENCHDYTQHNSHLPLICINQMRIIRNLLPVTNEMVVVVVVVVVWRVV
jgi:hypothetical protein